MRRNDFDINASLPGIFKMFDAIEGIADDCSCPTHCRQSGK
jgi:hypothetical protein